MNKIYPNASFLSTVDLQFDHVEIFFNSRTLSQGRKCRRIGCIRCGRIPHPDDPLDLHIEFINILVKKIYFKTAVFTVQSCSRLCLFILSFIKSANGIYNL